MDARRFWVTACAGLAVVALGGCAAAEPVQTSSRPTAAPSSTPSAAPVDPHAEAADSALAAMSRTEKVASLLMLHQPGTDPAALTAFVDATGIGGFILMGDNIPDDEVGVATLTAAMQRGRELPLLISIDQEGGWVSRLDSDSNPGADALKYEPVEATGVAFAARAALLESLGITMNFGIVADVTADPDSFIFDRVLGTDPAAAAARVSAAVTAENGLVASTIKHFPGHGSAPGDSHTGVPVSALDRAAWDAGDALPFRAGIDAGASSVMFGHLSFPAVDPAPASLSPRWHQILREELGFDGVAITDDMLMLQHSELPEYADPIENAVRAVAAGNDMLVYVLPSDPASESISVAGLIAGLEAAVDAGRIPQAQIDTSAWRLLYLRHELAG